MGGPGIMGSMPNLYLLPSSPLAELQRLLPDAAIEYDPGMSTAKAALLARRCDMAVVFGIRLEGEGYDNADLSLPWGQDAVIEAVADPRLLASYDTDRGQWHIAGGSYRLVLGHSAGDYTLEADVSLTEAWFGR